MWQGCDETMSKIVSCFFCGVRLHADVSIHEPYACIICGPQQFYYIALEERDRLL